MLKKLTILFPLLISINSFAQEAGIKGGIVVSRTHTVISSGSLSAPVMGVYYSYLTGKLKITAEPGYTTRGYSFTTLFTDVNGNTIEKKTFRNQFHCLELPLSIGMYSGSDRLKAGVNAGVAPGLIVSSNVVTDLKRLQLDVFGTVVLGTNLSRKVNLSLNLRFGKGLISITSYRQDEKYIFFSPFLSLGYLFISGATDKK